MHLLRRAQSGASRQLYKVDVICIADDDDENYIDNYAMMITMTVMLLIMIMAKTRMIMKMPLICIRFMIVTILIM